MNYRVDREATFGMLKGMNTIESGMQLKKLVIFILEQISLKREFSSSI